MLDFDDILLPYQMAEKTSENLMLSHNAFKIYDVIEEQLVRSPGADPGDPLIGLMDQNRSQRLYF